MKDILAAAIVLIWANRLARRRRRDIEKSFWAAYGKAHYEMRTAIYEKPSEVPRL